VTISNRFADDHQSGTVNQFHEVGTSKGHQTFSSPMTVQWHQSELFWAAIIASLSARSNEVDRVFFLKACLKTRVADGGDGLKIWRAAAIILNKHSRTTDKEWYTSLGIGCEVNNYYYYYYCLQGRWRIWSQERSPQSFCIICYNCYYYYSYLDVVLAHK
jgi:hypothetical protein